MFIQDAPPSPRSGAFVFILGAPLFPKSILSSLVLCYLPVDVELCLENSWKVY